MRGERWKVKGERWKVEGESREGKGEKNRIEFAGKFNPIFNS